MEKRSDHEILHNFAKQIADQYPELTPDQIYEICRTPFKLAANEIRSGSLKNIRIKYLGTFMVFPGRVKGILNFATKGLQTNKITEERFQGIKAICDNYNKFRHGKNSLAQTN